MLIVDGAAVKPSPKTDIIAGNFKISCKWEDTGYQLASGGIEWTFNSLKNALAAAYETGDVPLGTFGKIDEVLNDYAQTFGVGRRSKSSIDSLLTANQTLQQQISQHLGPVSSNADASGVHSQFNKAVVYEALTGNEQWGETSTESANYVLGNQSGFHKIDQNYVSIVAKYYSVRPYARKGRGSDPDPNIAQQELVGRLEVTEGKIECDSPIIVNGAQTSHGILDVSKKTKNLDAEIQLKVIKTDDEEQQKSITRSWRFKKLNKKTNKKSVPKHFRNND